MKTISKSTQVILALAVFCFGTLAQAEKWGSDACASNAKAFHELITKKGIADQFASGTGELVRGKFVPNSSFYDLYLFEDKDTQNYKVGMDLGFIGSYNFPIQLCPRSNGDILVLIGYDLKKNKILNLVVVPEKDKNRPFSFQVTLATGDLKQAMGRHFFRDQKTSLASVEEKFSEKKQKRTARVGNTFK